MSDVPFAALADVLEAETSPSNGAVPVSIRAPVQVQDFAFAETISARELGDNAPPSTPIFFDDASDRGHCVTPLAFPLPPAADDVAFRTRLRVGTAHLRHGLRGAIEEMSDLWRGAGEIVESEIMDGARLPPASSAALFMRKLRAAWSCLQWSASDLARAAAIGSGVLLVTATVFVSVVPTRNQEIATASGDSSSDASAEVRAPHTLEQHTGHKVVVRNKR